MKSTLLGVLDEGAGTTIGMTPANLTIGPRANITDIAIKHLEAGNY